MEILCILKTKSARASLCFALSAASLCAPTSNSPWCVGTTSTHKGCTLQLALARRRSACSPIALEPLIPLQIPALFTAAAWTSARKQAVKEMWVRWFGCVASWKVWHREVDAPPLWRKACRGSQHGLFLEYCISSSQFEQTECGTTYYLHWKTGLHNR